MSAHAELIERAASELSTFQRCSQQTCMDMLAALRAAPAWNRDMDAAPRDGTEILVCIPRQGSIRIIVRWSQTYGHWLHKGELTYLHHGDLWMPLPPPPAEEDGK